MIVRTVLSASDTHSYCFELGIEGLDLSTEAEENSIMRGFMICNLHHTGLLLGSLNHGE
jgi:hypothetical protein